MVRVCFWAGVAMVATLGVQATPVPRDLNVYGGKYPNYALVRRVEDHEGCKRNRKRKERVRGCGLYKPDLPSKGVFLKSEYCPWPSRCGQWQQVAYFKKHIQDFHMGSVPVHYKIPNIVDERIRRPKDYIVGGGNDRTGDGTVVLHRPVRTTFDRCSNSYKLGLGCPWICSAKSPDDDDKPGKPLKWINMQALQNHIEEVHHGFTDIAFNYPAALPRKFDNYSRKKTLDKLDRLARMEKQSDESSGSNPTPKSGSSSQLPRQAVRCTSM